MQTVSESSPPTGQQQGDDDRPGPSTSVINDDRPPPPTANDLDLCTDSMDNLRTDDETCLEAHILLDSFIGDQISKSGIQPECETPRKAYQKQVTANIRNAGRELRRMADVFENSYERRQVKAEAQKIGLNITSYSEFRHLLTALFNPGGITHSRIIVLFFFCSDVAIRCLKSGINLFKRFMCWSYQYFAEYVCDWVREHGGWVAVLSPKHIYPRVAFVAVAVAAVCVVVYRYVRK